MYTHLWAVTKLSYKRGPQRGECSLVPLIYIGLFPENRKFVFLYYVSKKGCEDQESIQSSTTPDPGYQWESDKLTVDTTNESQEVSPFQAGDHKAHINRRAQRHSKHKTEQKHKKSTEVPPWNGQKNILLEGLNRFNGAIFSLNSDVDQDT